MMDAPACRDSVARVASDFIPFFTALGEDLGYIWIYAAGAAEYNPYKTDDSRPIHDALSTALRTAPDRCPASP
jgi:hypothetical protein